MSILNKYDRLFVSMYVLSGKTHLDGQPNLISAWIMITGFEYANLMTIFFLYVFLSGDSVEISRGSFLAGIVFILVGNGFYIWLRGGRLLSCESVAKDSVQHRLGLFYGIASSLALLGVMAGMFTKVAVS